MLNGTKRFITNAPRAGAFTLMARTDGPGAGGISSFIVPSGLPGLSLGKPDKKMGQRGTKTCDVILDNVRVPAANIIGGVPGKGFKTAMKVLDRGRLHVSALACGVAQRVLNESVAYARERRQFGQRIGDFQLVQAMLADRFKMKVHKEPQPVTVYGLTANKSKLKASDPTSRSTCTRRAVDGALEMACTNTTMEQFARKIRETAGGYLDHPVVDLTELKGGYDFTVTWAPRNKTMGTQRPGESTDSGPVPVASDRGSGLTVFEAVDRQLGLKLATLKHPMQVVVIDRMERTLTEN